MATPLETARRNLIADVIAAIIGNDIEHVQLSMSNRHVQHHRAQSQGAHARQGAITAHQRVEKRAKALSRQRVDSPVEPSVV
ncbi:MAG: hypothetical protein JOY91_08750 [Sinobacteraceae bacterium]|nr:hypothetical protein [Nevskiaceae bacterium]